MFRLYGPARAERIVSQHEAELREWSHRYGIPAAYIMAVLRKEIAGIDIFDPLADLAVWFYWLRYSLRRGLKKLGLVRNAEPLFRRGPFGKHDSSTGFGQIFAWVGINAVNYALDRGLDTPEGLGVPADRRLSPHDPEDLRSVWKRLLRDRSFNARLSILNLVSCAEEMNGSTDFARYTPEAIQRTLTRYNADVRTVTAYGRETYRYYLAYTEEPNGHESV